jgi:hypothetical protein
MRRQRILQQGYLCKLAYFAWYCGVQNLEYTNHGSRSCNHWNCAQETNGLLTSRTDRQRINKYHSSRLVFPQEMPPSVPLDEEMKITKVSHSLQRECVLPSRVHGAVGRRHSGKCTENGWMDPWNCLTRQIWVGDEGPNDHGLQRV